MVDRAPDGTAFEVEGSAGAPVVALIHGLGLTRHLWQDLRLAFCDYRVVLFDLYGHGESFPAPRTASLTVYSDQLAGLLDHVGADRAHVVGFSIGGMINRRFALDHPERLNALVILNSPHDRGEAAQRGTEERAAKVRDHGAFSTFDAALQRWFTPEALRDGAGPALARGWVEQADPASYAQAAWVLANGVRELIAPDPPITAPTLVMTCENDPGSNPSMSRAIAGEIPGAQLRIVPCLRHLGLLENPAAFTGPVTDFLRGQPV